MTVAATPDLAQVLDGVGFVPERVEATDGAGARRLLDRDGAVVLTGLPVGVDSLPVAAAQVLGSRLRQLFPIRRRGSDEGGKVAFHTDSFNVVVESGGRLVRLRDPDEDYLLMQSAQQAGVGGESLVADAYRLVDRLRDHDPELYELLTTTDVDLYGAWGDRQGVPKAPYVCRLVEWTRAGRRIVRLGGGFSPLPRDADPDRVARLRTRYADLAERLFDVTPRVLLGEGEVLMLDNYRCWHGRDPHRGARMMYILTLRTDAAL